MARPGHPFEKFTACLRTQVERKVMLRSAGAGAAGGQGTELLQWRVEWKRGDG